MPVSISGIEGVQEFPETATLLGTRTSGLYNPSLLNQLNQTFTL